MALSEGTAAPDFSLPANDGRTYTLSELRGRVVVLNFYPADDTTVCTAQLCHYSENWSAFEQADAVVLAISRQDLVSKEQFAAKYGLVIPLLYDEGGQVFKAYGLGKLGGWRATFVVDRDGVIRWVFNSMTAMKYATADEIVEHVASIA